MSTIQQIARKLAQRLRKNSTLAEQILWRRLRNKQFLNLKFNRQHPVFFRYDGKIKFFIADFYCHEIKLVIEVDGEIRYNQKEYDQTRTEILNLINRRVIRFRNDEIYSDIENVLMRLAQMINPPPVSPSLILGRGIKGES
jgi:very-short-patch-repair endonuclease